MAIQGEREEKKNEREKRMEKRLRKAVGKLIQNRSVVRAANAAQVSSSGENRINGETNLQRMMQSKISFVRFGAPRSIEESAPIESASKDRRWN